jgi:hypothetical protein
MDYLKIYNSIIERGKNRVLSGYGENHHIVPKCVGGTNKKWNLVKLTAKEHYICHMLLCEIYPKENKLKYAFWRMCNVGYSKYQERNYRVSGIVYERLKKEMSIIISENRKGKPTTFGYKHTTESKLKIKENRLKQIITDDAKNKMSESHKNKLWYFNDEGKHLRTFPDDPRIIEEGWKKGRIGGKELSKLANEKRKEKYLTVEPPKPNSKKCLIEGLLFDSAVKAAKYFNMPDSSVRDRIRNKNFPTWNWI